METLKWIMFLAANIPVYLIVGEIVFGSWDDFSDAWKHSMRRDATPNWEKYKMMVYVLFVLACLGAEHHLLVGIVF